MQRIDMKEAHKMARTKMKFGARSYREELKAAMQYLHALEKAERLREACWGDLSTELLTEQRVFELLVRDGMEKKEAHEFCKEITAKLIKGDYYPVLLHYIITKEITSI